MKELKGPVCKLTWSHDCQVDRLVLSYGFDLWLISSQHQQQSTEVKTDTPTGKNPIPWTFQMGIIPFFAIFKIDFAFHYNFSVSYLVSAVFLLYTGSFFEFVKVETHSYVATWVFADMSFVRMVICFVCAWSISTHAHMYTGLAEGRQEKFGCTLLKNKNVQKKSKSLVITGKNINVEVRLEHS